MRYPNHWFPILEKDNFWLIFNDFSVPHFQKPLRWRGTPCWVVAQRNLPWVLLLSTWPHANFACTSSFAAQFMCMYMYAHIQYIYILYVCIYIWYIHIADNICIQYMSSGHNYVLNLMPCTNLGRPLSVVGIQYSRRYHKWGIGIGSSPIRSEGFVNLRRTSERPRRSKIKLVLIWVKQ